MSWEATTFDQVWADANCADHPQPAEFHEALTRPVAVLCAQQEVADWDNMSFALVRLADGRYMTVEEWEDSSGHGCRCGGATALFDTLEDALMLGLSPGPRDEARRVLGMAEV